MGSVTDTDAEVTHQRWPRWVSDVGAPWVLNAVVPVLFGMALGNLWWGLFVSCVAGVLPILMIVAMMVRRRVGDVHVTNRGERTGVIAGIVAFVLLGLVIELLANAPQWSVVVTAAGLVTIVAVGVVTVLGRWKISVHSAVACAWVVLAVAMVSPWSLLALPVPVVIGSARVALGDHTRPQVLVGGLAGAAIAGAAALFA